MTVFKFLFKTSLIFIAILIPIAIIVFFKISNNLPDPTAISNKNTIESTKIYDRTGDILLYDIHGEEKRTVVASEQISQYLKDATLAAEDDEFYIHKGVDFKAILRALINDILHPDDLQGGSTITQQLVKNSFLTSEKTITRKLKEALLSVQIERTHTKDEILTLYLNQIPYGSNSYGIESASQTFFNKKASELSLAESALLASLPKAPSYYSPYGKHLDNLLIRKDYVLDRMYKLGYADENNINSAKNETLTFSQESKGIKAPHFVAYIKEYLEEKYGYEYIQKAGLKVYTTLDYNAQKLAEDSLFGIDDHLKKYGASNVAIIALDSKTGQILTMVGSKDYFDLKNNGNFNVTTATRQPGSAFKPFTYAKLLEKGFTPETMFFDSETEFSTSIDQKESYKPGNYDGKFRGPVSLKSALAQSLNIPAVKALYIAGIDDTLALVRKMGITTINNRSRIGLSLALGGAEVKPIEMASAYSVFSNNGIGNPIASILKIEDSKGKILEKWSESSKRILDENIAKTITNILSNNDLRAPIFGQNNYLTFPNIAVAAKSGTTQEFKDAWIVGYTTNVSVAVWVGNNDNSSMKNSSATVAGPIFNKFIKSLSDIIVFGNFDAPKPLIREKEILNGGYMNKMKVKIDKASEKLITELTPQSMIIEKIYKKTHNILHYIDKNDILGEYPKNPENDPQYKNWEDGVIGWIKTNPGFLYLNEYPPIEYDDIHTKENEPKITIKNISDPNSETNYTNIIADIESKFKIKEVNFYINDSFLSSDFYPPYKAQIDLLDANYGENIISVKAYDEYQNSSSEFIKIIRQHTLFP
ncbi:MAG: PBP1A family penicillin-binding protein [Patescibacteria group bacterium]